MKLNFSSIVSSLSNIFGSIKIWVINFILLNHFQGFLYFFIYFKFRFNFSFY